MVSVSRHILYSCLPHLTCPSQVKRSADTTRVLLSADLVAEHLVNNGIFTHEGIKHIDRGHRAHNEGALRRIAGRGIATAIKYAFRPGVVYNEERWNAVSYVPLSDTYEFDVKDVVSVWKMSQCSKGVT